MSSSLDSEHPTGNVREPSLRESISPLPTKRVRVLFLCTHNSARSQMAEGILRHLSERQIEVQSAGSQPQELHPLAVQAMAKMGIDISQQRSKHLNEFRDQSFDYVVTVCDREQETCPTFPGDPKQIHWSFIDPAAVEGSEGERARAFEQVALQLMTRMRYFVILINRELGENTR